MKRKYLFILAGIFSICLLSAYVLYDRYGKYLPTTASDVVFPMALTGAQIQSIRQNTPIDIIHVYKNQRYLVLQHQNKIIRRYPIRLGFSPIGHKIKEGDGICHDQTSQSIAKLDALFPAKRLDLGLYRCA